MNFTDAVTLSGTRKTADGYLVAEARAVRTGVQMYLGSEVGRDDMPTVAVYRPEASVFDDASLQSFTHAPVTMDHPAEMVTAANWKDLAVGEVSTAAKRDGEWIALPLILKDAAAISAVDSGKRELSAGYTCELVWGDGVAPDGAAFQATQTKIKINHLAIVDRARAGQQARIGDSGAFHIPKIWGASPVIQDAKTGDSPMAELRKILVDGLQVETTDAGVAAIEKLTADKAKIVSDHSTAIAAKDAEIAKRDAELGKKDAEIDALKAKVLDAAALDKAVADRAELVTVAKSIAPDVVVSGLSDAAIRKAVVVAKLGDAVTGKTDAYIDARFDILAEDAKAAAVAGADPFKKAVADGVKVPLTADAAAADAYAKMIADMQSAHLPAAISTVN